MISIQNGVFHLETKNTAYLFDTTPTGHLRHPHYGAKLSAADAAAIYNLSYHASPARDTLKILSAAPGKRYSVTTVEQKLKISRFGGLIKHVVPVKLKPDGMVLRTVNNHYSMTDGMESYTCSGEALLSGIGLAMQYVGTGYDKDLRILGDNGSTLYLIKEEKE